MSSPSEPQSGSEPLYALEKVFDRCSRKFNVSESVYRLSLPPFLFLFGMTYSEIVDCFHHVFEGMLVELLFESGERSYPDSDRVRLSISATDLSHTIRIPFIPPLIRYNKIFF